MTSKEKFFNLLLNLLKFMQQAEEKKIGDFSKNVDVEEIIFQPKEAARKEEADNSKEEGLKGMASMANVSEEKLESGDVSVSDLTKKDGKHEKIGERENFLEESEVSNSSEPAVEANGGNLNSRADDAHEMSSEVREKYSDFVETSVSQEPILLESKIEDLKETEIKPTSENERKSDEATNPESSKDKVYIYLIKSEDSKDEIQVLDPAKIPAVIVPNASDVSEEIDFDSGNATSIEIPVKDLEVGSGSPEEQKSKENTASKELNSNESTIDAGREVFGSSSYEVKPSEDAEAVENKDDGLKVETMQASAKIQEDSEVGTKLAQIESDENVFQGVEVKKDDEIFEGGIEKSTVPVDVPSLAEISFEEAKALEPGVVVEEEETSLESDNIDTVPKIAEVLLEGENDLEGDKLGGKEKVVNAEAIQRDLADAITDPTELKISSIQVQAPTRTEMVDEALEVTSKEFNIAPEASEIFSEGDKISSDDLKSECLEGESATSMEAPADITTTEEPLDQVIEEKKIESSARVAQVLSKDKLAEKEEDVNDETKEINLLGQADGAHEITDHTESEVSSVQAQAPTSTEIVDEALEVTSKEFNIATEGSGVFSEGDKFSADDLKSECLEGESATSMEAPADITTAEEPLDQVIEEKKIESLVSETQVPSKDKLSEKEEDVNGEIKEINLPGQADGAHETPSVWQNDFADKSASQEPAFPESKTEDLKDAEIKPTPENDRKSEEAPSVSTGTIFSKDGNVEDEIQEAANSEISEDKVDIKLIKLEDSKDELQVLVPAEILGTVVVPDTSETLEKNDIDSSNYTSIEVPVKNLEVDSGSPEEQKSNEKTETKDLSSNVSAVNDGGEVVGFSSNETKPSGDLEVIEKNDILEVEAIQTSVEIHEDLEAKPESAQTQSDENVSVGVEVNRDDEIAESSIEIPTFPDDIPLANVSYEEEKASEPGVVVEEKEISLEGNNIDTVPKMADVSFEGSNDVEGDKLVDNCAEAVERDMVDTITDLGEAEVSFFQIKAPTTIEIVNEALEVTSKELNTAPEASEVPSEGDKLSTGDGKSENLKGEVATSVEAPKDISLDPVIEEKKIDSPVSERQAPSEDKLVDKGKDVNEEAKKINLQSQADGVDTSSSDETPGVVRSDFDETSTSQEPVFSESKNEDLEDTEIKPASENERKQEEAPLVSTGVDISEENNVLAEAQEAANPESSKDKVDIKLIELEGSKDEIQVLVPDKIPTVVVSDASETSKENDVDSSILISIEAPVDDPEIESGFLDEQKLKESTETNEPSSNVTAIDAGGEVVGSTSFEVKPSEDAKAVEKKDDGLEVETVQTSVKIQEDLDAKPELRQTHSNENVSRGVEVKNDDEIVEGSIATSTVPDVPPLVEVLSEEEKAAEPSVMVVEEESSLESDNINTVPKVADSIVLYGDKLVEEEKVVNAGADAFTDLAKAEVSSDHVKPLRITEIVNEALKVTSQDLIVAPEVSELPAEVDKFSTGDEEKSESMIVGEATSVETPKDIITIKDSLDQLSEGKNSEILVSEMEALTVDNVSDKEKNVNIEDEERDLINASTDAIVVEVSSEQVKSPEIIEEESDRKALEETSKELNVALEASEVPSVDDKLSAGEERSESLKGEAGTSVEAPKDITIAEESLGQVIEEKRNESSISKNKVLPEDKSIDREKYVNDEAEERDLVDTSTDPIAADVSSDQVKAFGTAEIIKEESNKQSSKVTSNEFNITFEASEIRSKGDEVSAGNEEKREGLESEDATSVEGPKDITIAEESPVQVIEKSESSISEKEAPPQDKLVDKEKNVKEEAVGRDLVDTCTDPTAAEMSSDQVKDSETAEIIKEESNKQALDETSKELNVAEASEIPFKGDEISAVDEKKSEGLESEDATLLEAQIDITIAEESPDQVSEKSENSVNEKEALPEDKLVDKEKNVNEEAEERDLVSTSTYPTAAEVYSIQVNAFETAEIVKEENKQALDEKSMELNIASEASEIPSKGDEVSVVDEEKREGLESEDATLVEAPKDITIAEESPDQVSEKSESSVSEKDVNEEAEERDLVGTSIYPITAEVYFNQVKASETAEIVKEESNKQVLDETYKEVNSAYEASEIPSKGDEVSPSDDEKREDLESEDSISVEAPKDITIAKESLDQVIEKSKNLVSEKEALPEDKLVDKEKIVNEGSEERDLVDTSTDPIAGEVSFDQLKAFESAEITEESNKQALEKISKELNIAFEASDVPSEGDKVSSGDEEKRESLKGDGDAALMNAPKDIIIAEESLDQVIEKESEIFTSEKEGPLEDKSVDKGKNVNEEAEEKVFVEASTDLTAAEVSSDQAKASEIAKEFNIASNAGDFPSKGDEVFAGDETKRESLEVEDATLVVTPKDIASNAGDFSSKGDEIFAGDETKRESLEGEDATLVVAPKDIIIAEECPDQGIERRKSERLTSEKEDPPKDKLADKGKNVNEEVEERELGDTSIYPTIAEVSSSQVQASETADIIKEASNKQALEITSKELNIPSESIDVPIEVDKVSSGEEEKNESLKGEVATSLEPPNAITAEEKSIDQLLEENKNESSKNETQAPIEMIRDFDISKFFPEAVKDIITSKAVEEKQDETSNDLSVAEKKANDLEDKKEEMKITDKPEQEELVAEKAESEKSKDQDPVVSSDSRDAKLTKEVSKRESNIFSKVKRSIVKAKKAILRKSPGPKTVSSEEKD